MNMTKFYTKQVEIYEKAKTLNDKLRELVNMMNFITDNYDSEINVTIEANSFYNYNSKRHKKILLPTDVVLDQEVTKKYVLGRLNSEIGNIKEQLKKLEKEII